MLNCPFTSVTDIGKVAFPQIDASPRVQCDIPRYTPSYPALAATATPIMAAQARPPAIKSARTTCDHRKTLPPICLHCAHPNLGFPIAKITRDRNDWQHGYCACPELSASGLCPETRPVALPPGPPPKAEPLESQTESDGFQAPGAWRSPEAEPLVGFGVKPRAHLLRRSARLTQPPPSDSFPRGSENERQENRE